MILYFIFSLISYAQLDSRNVVLEELPSKSEKKELLSEKHDIISIRKPKSINSLVEENNKNRQGNLPRYAMRRKIISSAINPVIYAKINEKEKLKGLVRSSILNARINDSIVAYDGSLASVKAVVTDGPYKGYVLFGNATMDKTTKNIAVLFDTLVNSNQEEYQLLAELKSISGVNGITGKIESDYWRYFWTQFALDTAAAGVQSSAEVTRNALGQYQVIPNGENVAKLGLAGGLTKTAERIAERNQYVPEFVKADGPFYVRIAILKQPERK